MSRKPKSDKTYTLYCDESGSHGSYYSNFYGGLLVDTSHQLMLERELLQLFAELNLNSELKWQRVTENYLTKYIAVVDKLFDYVAGGLVKIRIMFTQNRYVPLGLSHEQKEGQFFLLYYQFIKHAFGFEHAGRQGGRTILFLDRLPDREERCHQFKSYLSDISGLRDFQHSAFTLNAPDIYEADSRNHPLLQCLDIVLGSMYFRLNNLHLVKPAGSRIRGKRTRAKETLYKHINRRIREIRPNFNVGANTSTGEKIERWTDTYRHWLFKPSNREEDHSVGKKVKSPAAPTSNHLSGT
ncbi:MAG: DUF3800 domain-containing protein [Candidatus Eremiobacteraeota bacterium]|nr:DUF3800 domain-containing protein [Candidatus Eremiobacteraeota bacterium]